MVEKFKFWTRLKSMLRQGKAAATESTEQKKCRWGQLKQGCQYADQNDDCPYASGMFFQDAAGTGMTVLRPEQQAKHKAKTMEPLDPVHSCPKEIKPGCRDPKGFYSIGSPGSGMTISQKAPSNLIVLGNKSESSPLVMDNWTMFNASDIQSAHQ